MLAVLAAGASAANAAAQDLVPNGHFHVNLAGWTHAGGGSQSWQPLDWEANPASGSLRTTNNLAMANSTTGSGQCVPTSAGTYEAGAFIRIPSGQAGAGSASMRFVLYTNPSCVNPPSGSVVVVGSVPSTTTNAWVEVFATSLAVPPGTMSARVSASVTLTNALGTLAAHFDRVRFGPAGTTPVELSGFAVE